MGVGDRRHRDTLNTGRGYLAATVARRLSRRALAEPPPNMRSVVCDGAHASNKCLARGRCGKHRSRKRTSLSPRLLTFRRGSPSPAAASRTAPTGRGLTAFQQEMGIDSMSQSEQSKQKQKIVQYLNEA